jgi:glycosyltransferase involved in cell wall biosynthesis
LLRALHLLQTGHNLQVPLCLTGASGDEHDALNQLAHDLDVTGLVHELGFVSADDLRCIYAGAAAMVFPSLFEGYGLPILEAFQTGTPVLCSTATVLPETAEDGAAYFDPHSAEELAEQMLRILRDPEFGRGLRERGAAVLARSSMESTARGFQELYRRVSRTDPADL